MTAGSGLFHSERMHKSRIFLCALVVISTGWLGNRPAAAADCVSFPSAVFVTGSTAAKPLLVQLARYLGSLSAPITIVYQGQGSCSGVDAILSATLLQGSATSPRSRRSRRPARPMDRLRRAPPAMKGIGQLDGLPKRHSGFRGLRVFRFGRHGPRSIREKAP